MAAPSLASAQNPADTGVRTRAVFERNFRAGEIVFDEGQPGDHLYVIQVGQVELMRSVEGAERVISRHGPGEFFGELSVLLGQPRTARAVAMTDTRLLQLDGATFESLCVGQPEIAIRVIQRLAARAIHLEQRLAALGADDLLRPVVRALVRRLERRGREGRVQTSLRALAADAGLSLPEAHRALGQLMDRRLLRLAEDVLVVPDVEALSASLDAD